MISHAITLSSTLIRISSITGDARGQARVQDACLAALADEAGLRFQIQKDRGPLPWTLVRTEAAPTVLFVCHTDTVPVGPGWRRDPHSGEVSQGLIHGRGSADMKSGLAATICTLIHAARSGAGAALLMTSDEEIGGIGAAEFASQHNLGFEPKLVIIPEATNNAYSRGHRGAAWFDVTAHGLAAHGSKPETGVNAIMKLSEQVISRLSQAPLAEDTYLGKDSINLGMIEGGQAPNMVPDRATLVLDSRTVAGGEHLRRWLETLDVEVHQRFDLPSLSPRPLPPVMDNFTDCGAATYFTDGAMIQELVGTAPIIIWGPGHTDQMHTVDEVMHIDSLRQALDNYLFVVDEL